MAHYSDWLPTRRADQIAMAKKWCTVLHRTATAWGVPPAVLPDLAGRYQDAEDMLGEALSSARTAVITARCKEYFDKLTSKMRDIKKRYFLTPPLTDANYVELGLNPPDTVSTPVPPPEGFPEADVSYPGVGVLTLHPRPVKGQPPLDDRSEYGYRIFWGAYPPGGATVEQATGKLRLLMKPPATGDDLPKSEWTRRHKENIDFHECRGHTVYFCVRYENPKGDYGPWGPMFTAIVP